MPGGDPRVGTVHERRAASRYTRQWYAMEKSTATA
jgi:hypothetical protein